MIYGITNPPYYDRALMIDIDGTVVNHDIPGAIPGAVEWVNKKYDEGYGIFFFTSRLAVDKEVTEQMLKKHGFKYHDVIYGKPYSGSVVHIDDRKFKSLHVPRNLGVTAVKDDDLK